MFKNIWKKFLNWLKAELISEVSDKVDIDGDGPEMEDNVELTGDGVPFDLLEWTYGGFDGSQASPVDGVKIFLVSVTPDGLRYHFKSGSLSALSPANSHSNPDCIACLFVRDGDRWCGGKFDWISSDRLTRDFHNIETGYHGWTCDAVVKANEFAFVIVSRDGTKRTNVAYLAK